MATQEIKSFVFVIALIYIVLGYICTVLVFTIQFVPLFKTVSEFVLSVRRKNKQHFLTLDSREDKGCTY